SIPGHKPGSQHRSVATLLYRRGIQCPVQHIARRGSAEHSYQNQSLGERSQREHPVTDPSAEHFRAPNQSASALLGGTANVEPHHFTAGSFSAVAHHLAARPAIGPRPRALQQLFVRIPWRWRTRRCAQSGK
ncbi:MAG TPA: hypothetical protein VLD18_00315, partial [Verrucomicrobiae bacterium]|nr:hypothetical protein [Verrucomicrobiae bacterium]